MEGVEGWEPGSWDLSYLIHKVSSDLSDLGTSRW